MVIDIPANMNYKQASQYLVSNLDLNNIQLSSYNNFIKNRIRYYLNPNRVYKEDGFELVFNKWWIDTSEMLTVDYCKAKRKSLEVSLKALVTITFNERFVVKSEALPENSITLEVEVTRFPHLTENGNFVINGVDKVLISHLEKADKLIINPPDPKKNGQFGQLELKNRLGSELKMDTKVMFRKIKGLGSDAQTIIFSYEKILQELGYKDDALASIVGINPHIQESNSGNKDMVDDMKSRNINKVMSVFTLDIGDRQCINEKTSFKKNLTGKVLAKDIEVNGKRFSRGHIVSPTEADLFQEAGILSVRVNDKGLEVPIRNNGFVDTEALFAKYELEIPDDFRLESRDPLDPDRVVTYYVKCNKEYFEKLIKEFQGDKDQLYTQIRLNIHNLIGTVLVKNDLTAMMNLFSRCSSNLCEFDDIDNLENKKVVNISDIFEQGLVEAIGINGLGGDGNSLIGKIKKARKELTQSTASESGTNLLFKMNLNLDCGERTITKATSNLSLFNIEDATNPLAQTNHKRKITLSYVKGRGGIKAMSSDVNSRSVNPSYSGRIDCIETPESQVVGLVRQIGALTYLNEFGQLEAPFFKVDKVNKVIDTSKIYYMTYSEELAYHRVLSPRIADSTGVKIIYHKNNDLADTQTFDLPSVDNVQLSVYEKIAKQTCKKKGYTEYHIEVHKKNWFIEDRLNITEGHGKTISGSPEEVDFVSCSGEHIFSPVTSAIPFIEYDDAARGMMGSVMSKQAIPIWGAQKQIVKTPMANMVTKASTGVLVAPYDLEVTGVDACGIRVRDLYSTDGKEEVIPCLRQDRTVKTTLNKSTPTIRVGDICLKGDVIADNASTIDGELAHGTNLLMAIIPLYGFNYEDGVLINEKLVREDIYTSFHIEEVEIKVTHKQEASKKELQEITSDYECIQSNKYDDKCIIKRGVKVKPNDILGVKIIDKKARKGKPREMERKAVVTRYEETVPGTVVSVETYEEKDSTVYTIKVANKLKMGVGDKYTGRHGNKGIVCRVLPEEDMPYLPDGRRMDIVVNPLGVPSRMNIGQLLDGHAGFLLYMLGLRGTISVLANFGTDYFKKALHLGNAGKQQLYDGRTGKPFRYLSSVTMPYTEKLEHVVAHKIHARANRPYTRKKQPTQGKASNGGQRLGEMEFWNFIAHGCVYIQRELTMFKSDDVENRNAFIDAITSNEEDLTSLENRVQNVPYAFQLTDTYYKSMWRRLVFYDKNGNEVDIYGDANKPGTRSLDKSLEIASKDKVKQTISSDVEEEELDMDFEDEEDLGLDLSGLDLGADSFIDSPTDLPMGDLPLPVSGMGQGISIWGNDAEYEEDTEEEEDNEPLSSIFDQGGDYIDENDLTGDEMFEDEAGNEEETEDEPF